MAKWVRVEHKKEEAVGNIMATKKEKQKGATEH